MRLKLALLGYGVFFLLLLGMRPDSMPYPNTEARFSDSITAHWPNALFLRESVLDEHQFPVWRETTLAGQPFAANPLNKTAYPLQWLALLFQPALFLNLMIVLHLLIAGSGIWRWAKSLGLRQEAVVFSAAAYAFAPQMIGRIGAGHFDILYALAWWPWLMWSVKQASESSKNRLISILEMAILTALVFLGDTRTSLFALVTAGIYEIVCLVRNHKLRDANWHLWLVPVFLLLAISVFISLRLWSPYVTRADLTVQDAGVYSLEPIQFLGLILPALQNVETQTYLGLPILALAVIAILSTSRRNQLLWLIALAVIVLYAMGFNSFIWPPIIKLIPTLLWFRIPPRAWLILTVLMPLLGAYGLQWLLDQLESGQPIAGVKRLNLLVTVTTFVSLLIGVFALAALQLQPTSTILISLALGIILLAALNRRLTARWTFIALMALMLIDLARTGYQTAQWRSPAYWLDPYQALAERLVAEQPDRIYSPTYSLEQQVAETYHLHLFGGVDPFQLTGIVDGIEQGSGIPITAYSPVVPPLEGVEDEKDLPQANMNASLNTQILAQWHVSHVVSGHPLDNARLQLVDTVSGVYIYKNLDYAPRPLPASIPDWPANAPGLPDAATAEQFNQITILASLVSGIAWIVVVVILIVLKVKHSPVKANPS